MTKIYNSFIENEAAIRRVFSRFFNNSSDVEELTQDTFVKCFAAEMTTEIDNPRAFLFRVAKNLAISERKKMFRTTTNYIEDSGGSEAFEDKSGASAEMQLDSKQKLATLSEAIAQLPEDYRRALIMKKMDGLKLTQIATRTNVSVRTVQKRIAKSLEMCDSFLRNRGYEPSEFGGSGTLKSLTKKMVTAPASNVTPFKMPGERHD